LEYKLSQGVPLFEDDKKMTEEIEKEVENLEFEKKNFCIICCYF
jgi:hypothetical protein